MLRIAEGGRGCVLVCSLVLAVVAGRPAVSHAAIHAQSQSAYLRVPQSDVPSVLSEGADQFSFMMWLHRSATDSQPMYVIDVPGVFDVFIDAKSQTIRSRLGGSGGPLELVLPLRGGAGSVPVDEWILIAVSWEASSGLFEGWARSQNVILAHDSVVVAGFVTSPPEGDLSIGQPEFGGAVAQRGQYGLIVFRDHPIDGMDFDALWDARDYFGPYRLENTAKGGNLTGTSGMDWMVHHAILTLPVATVIGSTSPALPGHEVAADNYCIYDANQPGSTFLTAGPVQDVSTGPDALLYVSPYDVSDKDSFFIRQVPSEVSLPDPPYVSGVSPKIRQIADGSPQGLLRCLVSANSRGTRTHDADEQTWPENYAHGFIEARLDVVSGVLNRPAALYTTVNTRWFGFDTIDPVRRSGEIRSFPLLEAQGSFSRLWSGAGPATVGPGVGVWMDDGAVFSLKCRPEPGSLLIATAPLVVRTYLLRFPGAGTVVWRPEKSAGQSELGTLGAPTAVDLGSSPGFTHTLVAGDTVLPAERKLILSGDFRSQIHVGDACYIGEGLGQRGFAVVSAVDGDAAAVEVTFEHWFVTSPELGSVLHFGSWEIVTIEHEWPALDANDDEVWRGLELQAVDGPIVNFAWDAWRPDVDGIAFGIAGWGGRGYTPQIEESFEAAIPAWMAALGPDVWLQGFAEQQSQPSSMADYLAIIRQALPGIEVAWLGDGEHGNGTHQWWHQYILANAGAADVVAVTVLLHEALGTFEDQCVDGLRSDAAHWGHRGNSRLAEGWLDLLSQAALPSADLDGDGTIGPADLAILLTCWGTPCGDLNSDGTTDPSDLAILLANWG